ncbi:hypothetical protein C0075_23100 [Rhizobium sp. KAs_5_22]|nr:hypothetical protein C0075_23100 [Rhizobium sp. KAs_5_22]
MPSRVQSKARGRGYLPLTLTLSPQAGRGDGQRGAAYTFSPLAGRRCRQADEGHHPSPDF